MRDLFPVARRYAYLNHAAIAPLAVSVSEAVRAYLASVEKEGILAIDRWVRMREETRAAAAAFVGASPGEIAFVRNTSHGLSLVAEGLDWRPGENAVTPRCEFPSNIYPWMNLERRGVETRFWERREGRLELDDLARLVDAKTRVVSLSWVEFTDGLRSDLAAVGALCRERGVLFCVDAIQGLGAIPLDLGALPVDCLAADGHKWLLAPEGTGLLFVSKRVMDRIRPVVVGWHSVQNPLAFETVDFTLREDARKFEEGSSSFMGIAALGAAIDLLAQEGMARVWRRIRDLCDEVAAGARARGAEILSPLDEAGRSGIVTLRFPGRPAGALLDGLAAAGVVVSHRGGGIRVSPHAWNDGEDLDRLFAALDNLL